MLFKGSFTERYDCDKLVWYEVHEDPIVAITREKRIKDWQRAWKKRLIEAMNRIGGTCQLTSASDAGLSHPWSHPSEVRGPS